MFARVLALAATLLLSISAALAQPADPILEKKIFELPSYTTAGGATIKNVKVGWEAYGTLNADKSNAILITHFFSGTSHAFGKYAASDAAPGYWNSIIGPSKAIDTDKYYVLSSDTLVNLNVNAPNVTTTGPASINPDTGKPYGMSFPVVSIKDFVNVQTKLIESLGIKRLRAVVGASMGGLQAYEWAASYPDKVDRIVAVVAAAQPDPFLTGWLDVWAAPIKVDAKWNGGDYYGKEPPVEGLAAALKVVSLHANHDQWAISTQGGPADASKDPAAAFDNKFKIQATLDAAGMARAKTSDANHFLYLIKANQLASVDPAKITVPALVIYSSTDLVFYAPTVEDGAKKMPKAETMTITGPYGHLNGVLAISPAGDKIGEFLAR
ncbi:MAG: homoserine O-acetyltransferase [Pseudolabrys sp.]|nr:homoserine O-acetyltransferase [Pseudolabrys sp.]MBV9261579.1 homoserine O-acetyltransferase [Pseudolabrys sp.]